MGGNVLQVELEIVNIQDVGDHDVVLCGTQLDPTSTNTLQILVPMIRMLALNKFINEHIGSGKGTQRVCARMLANDHILMLARIKNNYCTCNIHKSTPQGQIDPLVVQMCQLFQSQRVLLPMLSYSRMCQPSG